ncbi:MAG: universal stress protein [Pegethrix bostrychoides GSE-TBD4-15B]|jgi:nucleotide-binding universal stress UspA family protein|uniref:Universal stress protein n=1 Tax=Pegethrix bostrychoides GSE-TBD4-15B TaxID=2839662 RepID=A0A951U5Y8_9CYAN|nr:universal stress protein [Pegethrix bostrychoides GSE-TBD4-15B]
MNIKPMLLRLQGALGQDNLGEQMLLYPGVNAHKTPEATGNFVIGYNGSPNSQTALDFVLWMAHQTRQATGKQVLVHVVYVMDCYNSLDLAVQPDAATCLRSASEQFGFRCDSDALLQPQRGGTQVAERQLPMHLQPNMLDQVDRILWQARCLSGEWRGAVEAHLRFGAVATELLQVAQAQAADLLFVGCSDVNHALVQQLRPCLTCPILGIPTELEAD